MFNLYTDSAILCSSKAASLSYSLNDCPENCSSSFNGGYPSSSCCCCSCCCCSCSCCSSIRINTVNCSRLVPVNPSFSYGFRQSTLIQLPLSRRRLIFSSGAPVGDLGPTRSTYGRLAFTRDIDRIKDQGMKSIRKGSGLWGFYSGMSGLEERYVFHKVNDACDDAEAMISLLSEELCEEDFSVSERRKKKVSSSSSSSKKGKVRESVYGRRFEGHSWDGLENVEARERKEHSRVKRQGKDFVKSEDLRLRKGATIGSSNYLCSDLGDLEVKTKMREECVEVGLIGREKESRKRVGVVTINKQTKDDLERQKIEKHEYLESGRRVDIEVETSAGLDLRKASNKKVRKELIEEIVSGRESVLNQTRLSEAHISSLQTGSTLKKQYNHRAGESVSDVNSSFGYSQTDNRVSETSHPSYKYECVTGNSGFDDEKTTSYSSIVDGNEEHVVSDSKFCRTCGQVTSGSHAGSSNDQQPKFQKIQSDSAAIISSIVETNDASGPEEISSLTQKSANEVSRQHNKHEHLVASNQINLSKSEHYTKRADAAESYKENTSISRHPAKRSEIDSTDMRLMSTLRHQSDTRTEKQEETTLIETSLKEVNEKRHQESRVSISQTDIMRRNQNRIEIVDTGHSNVQDTSRTQQKQEARVKGSEEKTVLISSQLAKGERYRTDTQLMSGKQSREESKVLSGSSQVHIGETILNSSSASEERLHYQQNYVTEKVKETHEHIKETIKQTELRYQVQPPIREPSIVEKETSRHPWVISTSQVRIEEIGEEEDQENLPSGPSPRLAQPPLSTEVHPVFDESASRFSSQDSRTNSGESSIYTDPLAMDESPHVDLLGSAIRMDNLYHQVIGNFVENIRYEESTPVIEMEKKLPERQLLTDGVEYTYEKSGSGTGEESTDETLTLQQPPAREASENAATPHNGIVRRSGRALWNVAAKILRLRWGVLSESRKSTVKSSGQSSLNDPVGSETLLSGYDPNDAPGGDMKMGFLRVPLEPSSTCQPLPVKTSTHSPRDKPEVSNMGDNTRLVVDSALSPSFGCISGETNIELNVGDNTRLAVDSSLLPLFGGISGETGIELNVGGNAGLSVDSSLSPLFGGASGETNMELNIGDNTGVAVDSLLLPSFGGGSGETNIELNVDEMSSQATASMDWTQPAAMQFRRSHRRSDAIYELHEGGTEATASSTVDQIKGDLDTSLNFDSDSEENENVTVQEGRNLLRSNQVMKERFDDWGEAYRLESEQRKIDETFMKEALEEAKKAVDMWEFPVGAVLTQHGKVIARGHNLVEDLRDSTAHAEILCIREASNILRTWRLSEATLYVTLEPCAMCAGAILQARVGTLVYGAPNKLLGADGSWVRLFPGSVDGEGGSESTANPEGPVHPFHPKMTIRRGILEVECSELMQQSFKLRRKKDKTTEQPDEKRSNRKVHHPSKLLHKMHHMFLFCL